MPHQRVFLIALTDEKKEWTTAHAIADEISLQDMSRPFVLKQHDEHGHIGCLVTVSHFFLPAHWLSGSGASGSTQRPWRPQTRQ